ncbi:MAG: TraR/DksA family transcriptional regulator [Patescibacteria group bacterium]
MGTTLDHFEQSFVDQQRQTLQGEKERLEKQLHGMTGDDAFNKDKVQVKWDEMGEKEEDNAVEVAQFQDSISLERNLEEQLERINDALRRLGDRTYGICEVCGNPIEQGRLTANPSAVRCVKDAARK